MAFDFSDNASRQRGYYRSLPGVLSAPKPSASPIGPHSHSRLRGMPLSMKAMAPSPSPTSPLQKLHDPNVSKIQKAELLIQLNSSPAGQKQLASMRGRVDLTGEDLTGVKNLHMLPFGKADVSGSTISADLRNSDTRNMKANTATFTGGLGDISGAQVDGAVADRANMNGANISGIRGSLSMNGAMANHLRAYQPGEIVAKGAQLGGATIDTSAALNISDSTMREADIRVSGPGLIATNVDAENSHWSGTALDPVISGNFNGAHGDLRIIHSPELGAAPKPKPKPKTERQWAYHAGSRPTNPALTLG